VVDDEARPSTQTHGKNRWKTPQIMGSKIGPKIPPKIMKMKNIAAQDIRWLNPKAWLYWCESRVYMVWKPPQHQDLSLSLLSYLTPSSTTTPLKKQLLLGVEEGWLNACLSTNHWGPIYSENKRLEHPYGLKRKLHLMKGSLVWLPLRHTRRHRTDRLLLHFYVTSTMMPRAPPAITPPLVLRQNWET
jgi:hypothetical protein